MKQLLSPEPIYVDYPESDDQGSNHVKPMQTALFRKFTFLPEALYTASERAPTHNLSVISAGCSIGAEVDSLLALHRGDGYEGGLSVRGYDYNKLAIETARNGLYAAFHHYHGYEFTLEVLRSLGFKASYGGFDSNRPSELRHRVDVDATPLREGYDIEFAEHDLTKPLLSEGVDLVLANNLLYNVPRPLSNTVLRNLCRTLSDNGVLSVDVVSMNESDSRATEAMQILDEEFDMTPIMVRHSNPVMFGRT